MYINIQDNHTFLGLQCQEKRDLTGSSKYVYLQSKTTLSLVFNAKNKVYSYSNAINEMLIPL